MDQIAQAMRQTGEAATTFVAGAEESQAAAEGLAQLADQLIKRQEAAIA